MRVAERIQQAIQAFQLASGHKGPLMSIMNPEQIQAARLAYMQGMKSKVLEYQQQYQQQQQPAKQVKAVHYTGFRPAGKKAQPKEATILAQLQHQVKVLAAKINALPDKQKKTVKAVKVSAFKPLQQPQAEPFAKSAANIIAKHTGKPIAQPEPFANSAKRILESWRRGVSIGS